MVGALPAFNPHTKELHFQGFSDLCRNFRTEVLERWKSESKRVLGPALELAGSITPSLRGLSDLSRRECEVVCQLFCGEFSPRQEANRVERGQRGKVVGRRVDGFSSNKLNCNVS